jgi:acyl carrier protein
MQRSRDRVTIHELTGKSRKPIAFPRSCAIKSRGQHEFLSFPRTEAIFMPAKLQTDEISRDVFDVITAMIRSVSAKANDVEITPDTLLLDELAMDSMDLVRVILLVEDRYCIAIDLDEVPKIRQVRDLTQTVTGHSRSAA